MTNTFGTFLTGNGEEYLPGVIALSRSLNHVTPPPRFPLTVFATNSVDHNVISSIKNHNIEVETIKDLTPPRRIQELNNKNGFSHWNHTFSKLQILSLTSYKKIVLLDSDMLIKKNIDELFEASHLSAVIAGRSANPRYTLLNSGLMVIEPEVGLTDRALTILNNLAEEDILKYRGIGDQDLFHLVFPDWPYQKHLHLSEKYNLMSDCINKYISEDLIDEMDIKVVHFATSPKPWKYDKAAWMNVVKRTFFYRSFAELRALRTYQALANLNQKSPN